MADGNLVRQSNVGKNSMVFGPSIYEVPLLPYERQLIETIGITEEEYRKFAAEVRRKGLVRPAEYEHLPDIQATGTEAVLISLAISLVLTGVSYLLTPKPKMPEASKRSQLDLGSVNTGNRFTQSRGFDTLNELADYGSPIPIIFGLYNETTNSGGMLVTPKLVWSRVFSHGTQQSALLMFVVGEQGFADNISPDGIAKPDLEGVFLGNNALDIVHKDFFSFYWKPNTTIPDKKRIRASDLVYGTQQQELPDDEDVFLCPSNISDASTEFCHAYSPANNVSFGVHSAIPNGTGYRVNYEVVSIPDGTENSQVYVLVLRRMKIVGAQIDFDEDDIDIGDEDKLQEVRKQDMEGEGRQYSPRMGLTKLIRENGATVNVDDDVAGERRHVAKDIAEGDQVEFTINPSSIRSDKYQRSNNRGGENVDDINSTVEAEQIAADEAMQLGERFAIGNTLWKVVKRRIDRFDPDVDTVQIITLKCIDVSESNRKEVGLVSENIVIKPDDEKGFISDKEGIGASFFPLTKVATGLIRNNRPAVVTEIGLRSKVFQRLNGLCAFNSVPTTSELDDFDDQETTVRSGTYTGTIKRTSVFQVFVRRAGVKDDGTPYDFQEIKYYFAVTGSRPVDQYNFIRFTHPQELGPVELEYKFVGIPAAELRGLDDETLEVYVLSASVSDEKSDLLRLNAKVNNLGTFTIAFAGTRLLKFQIKDNKEFIRKFKKQEVTVGDGKPKTIIRDKALPLDADGKLKVARSVQLLENTSNDNIRKGRTAAFFYEIFGNADNDPINEGGEKSLQTREEFDDGRWIALRWTVEKQRLREGNFARENNGINFAWAFRKCVVVGSSDGFQQDERIEILRGLKATSGPKQAYSSSNPFIPNNPDGTLTFSGQVQKVSVEEIDLANGRSQAYYYEVFGNAANLSIGETNTIIRNYPNGPRKIKVTMTATVIKLENHFSGENKGWQHPSEIIVSQDSDTTDNWSVGDTYEDLVQLSANNPHITSYTETGFRYKIGNVNKTEELPKNDGDTFFESQSQYADQSLYRGLVQKSHESEPEHTIVYVNEVVPNLRNPGYNHLTTTGLALKASRNFTSLDQMRCWLGSGLHVKRLHPDLSVYNLASLDANGKTAGPSNLFTDLVFYLLTNQMAGAGGLLRMDETSPSLLNEPDFVETSRFLYAQKLFFNGVLGDKTNLRQYITDTAPYFLCNFVIMDGKFSLKPAVPHMPESGLINLGPVPIEQLFTAGNILEDSYKLEYLRSEERRSFKAVMRYREESKNKFPQEKTIDVKFENDEETELFELPQEQFDLTQFCTSEAHAIQVAKYFLAIRRLVQHTISFSTTVHGLNLRAGSYIKVITTSSPYSSANNGTVSSAGQITSVQDMPDGQYSVSFFQTNSEEVEEGTMNVSSGRVSDERFHDSVFTIKDESVSQNVYVVEQLTFSQEGTVDIVASEHPCDANGVSELAKLIASDDDFRIVRN